ncbi:MAG TPA: V-type ATP synthase subunit E [Thermoanaerobacterales bacterium]|jgi:V/A-type H+-transporting ATPase subunit E|nr:V-type ATP synthase subunit E [Thermoanaerobacterales bacterium]
MEGIERIKQKILQEAQNEKEKIIDEAKREVEAILQQGKIKCKEVEEQAVEKAEKQAEEERRKIISIARLEERKRLLDAKQKMIDQVFKKVEQDMASLDADVYNKLIYNMLIESAITGDEEVIICEKDSDKITPELLSQVNKALKEQGKAGELKLAKTKIPCLGGFILKSKDVQINNTFDALMKIQREDMEAEIAKILFEE